ncbi:MAG: ATP-binding protein [Deltaproteobacteria bacterium]
MRSRALVTSAPHSDSASVNLAWLVRLRWGAIGGQALTIIIAATWLDPHLTMGPLLGLVAVEAVSNLVAGRYARRDHVNENALGVVLAVDVVILTLLLAYSGGPSNPFNFLYLVYIALAAVIVRARWAWVLVGMSGACFGALFLIETHDHNAPHDMAMHVRGMWVAFCVAAVFIAYFVQRVHAELREREAQLASAQKLASLATLSAGAAHELSTPLSTIAVVAKELERALEASDPHLEDVTLIRSQVQRCRTILDQMAVDAGASTGEGIAPVTLSSVIDAALEGLSEEQRRRIEIERELAEHSIRVPLRAFSQSLRALVKNGLEASKGTVRITSHTTPRALTLEVWDDGDPIAPDVLSRVGDPFFTTKAPGSGMGLGVFLARAVTESLGGALSIESRPGRGTCARMSVATNDE